MWLGGGGWGQEGGKEGSRAGGEEEGEITVQMIVYIEIYFLCCFPEQAYSGIRIRSSAAPS